MILGIESVDVFVAEEAHQVSDRRRRGRVRLFGRLVDGDEHLHQPHGVIGELGHGGQIAQRFQDLVLRHGRGEIAQKCRRSRIGGQRAQDRSHDHSAHRIGQRTEKMDHLLDDELLLQRRASRDEQPDGLRYARADDLRRLHARDARDVLDAESGCGIEFDVGRVVGSLQELRDQLGELVDGANLPRQNLLSLR